MYIYMYLYMHIRPHGCVQRSKAAKSFAEAHYLFKIATVQQVFNVPRVQRVEQFILLDVSWSRKRSHTVPALRGTHTDLKELENAGRTRGSRVPGISTCC